MPEADHLDLSHPTGAALETTTVDSRTYQDLADEAAQYAWTQPQNTTETADDAARRYATELHRLETELFNRRIQPDPSAPIDSWAVDLALTTIDTLTHAHHRAQDDDATLWKTRLVDDTARLRKHLFRLAELTDASRRLVETLDVLDKAHGFGHPDLDSGIRTVRAALERAAASAPATAAVASVPRVARESGRLAAQGEVVHATDAVLCDVADERTAQDTRWGEQNHPDGTSLLLAGMADDARRDAKHAASQGQLTWLDILAEEFWEAMAEEDPARLRVELIQVAATAVAWAEAIDRRAAEAAGEDLMTPGMPNPCQPIGCDNGHHLPGCTYADVDEVADHA